jgi:general stress protein YciG
LGGKLEVVKITTVNEAGRKGGLATLAKCGNKHFSEIGKKGQEVLRERFPGMASVWGKKGGRPRKNNI